jgi:hypothetical protein
MVPHPWHVITRQHLHCAKIARRGQPSKHIDVLHHFARDHVMTGDLDFVHCKSENNISDCRTKALTRPLFAKGLCGLGMISA